MITLIEIYSAIDNRIKEAKLGTAFSAVPIIAEDVTEPIKRASFKISFENSINGKFNANCREKNLHCRIYFFATDKNKYQIDNIKMQEILENALLNDLKIKEGFYIPIENVDSEVVDGVLICSFDLYMVELLPDNDTSEPMENLNLNLRKDE